MSRRYLAPRVVPLPDQAVPELPAAGCFRQAWREDYRLERGRVAGTLREGEIIVLRLLQDDFPVCPRPFLEIACRANRGFCRPRTVYFEVIGPGASRRPVVARHKVRPMSEREVLAAASGLVRRGHVRRIAAVFGSRADAPPGSLPWRIVQELQGGLPLVAEPYRDLSRRLGLSEDELLEKIRSLKQTGYLRRLGAILGPPMRQRHTP